ncbi:hypothetical protein EG346_18770 [Chryseobacterium carnipullorum]|uniref:Uncharacterized protein n=1 Tax=Chryseobacterium carnipullorum TaxID=1124835 RepID=A0A3G6NI24_CHRCU|nr:hypothetical protein EG346_18770 [Chryseobacterium carnipullorum]AZA67721.1 hypothetical protein EG345_09805 [Chryseobacterium carnipullorum]
MRGVSSIGTVIVWHLIYVI